MAKSIAVVLNAVVGPYMAQMRSAAAATGGFSAAAKGASASVGGLVESTGLINKRLLGAAGGVLAIKSVANAAVDWESAFAGVRKTVDGTETQMASLERGLRDMSTEIPVAATELASIAEAAGQLGVETGNIEEFTEVIASLGVATNLSSEQAATQLARFANIMGTSQEDFDKLGSSIVHLGNNFATTESEILELSLRMAAAGKIAGLSEGDIFGMATALTSVGVNAEAGGTAMSKVFTTMNDAVIDGSDNLQTFADVAGMSASDFRQAYENDAAGAIDAFIIGMGEINAAGGSTSQVFKDLKLNDERLKRAVLSAAEAGGLFAEAIGDGNDALEENVALQREAEQRFGTTESQIQMAKNAFQDLKVELGNELLPILGEVASAMTQILTFEIGTPDEGPITLGRGISESIKSAFGLQGFGRNVKEETDEAAEGTWNLFEAWESTKENVGEFVSGAGASALEWLQKGAEGAAEVAGAQGDMAMYVEDANEKLRHQLDLFEELSSDPVDQLMSALDAVEDAQTSYTDAVKKFGQDSPEAAEAAWELFRANTSAAQAADVAAGKYGSVENAVVGMYEAGLINNEQMQVLLGLLGDTRTEAEGWAGTYTMILDVNIDAARRRLGELRNAGFSVSIDGTLGGIPENHTGGIVSGSAGMAPGLDANERLRVLQVGERVVSAQSAGAYGTPSSSTTVGSQVTVEDGAIRLQVRDEQAGMRAASRQLKYMQLGYS